LTQSLALTTTTYSGGPAAAGRTARLVFVGWLHVVTCRV
jgi:hypothetical protein